MDKLKRFVDCYIDTETCNFKCHYCYIALLNKFNKKETIIVNYFQAKNKLLKILKI